MPLYEYKCVDCENVHEIMQKFSDPPLSECPNCKGVLTKLISLSSFALKGSGWYTTDYKKTSSTPSEKPKVASGDSSSTTSPSQTPAPSTPTPAKSSTQSTS